MEKLGFEFQNGNWGVQDWRGPGVCGVAILGGLASHPPHRTRKGGAPGLYVRFRPWQVGRFYLTPLLIAVAYFLAKPLPTKSS